MSGEKSGNERTLGLGIDAGGSYTDAVVMDMRNREVLARAKTPTTHEDLIIGLMDVLEQLISRRSFDPVDVRFVGLSTTLATNSILEGRGGKVGLVGIGWAPDKEWPKDATASIFVAGGHDVQGKMEAALDEKGILEGIEGMKDKVDAIVVSARFSCYNSAHEERAREIIRRVSDLPVIAAHELSEELGVHERTNTAIINGRLLPIIDDFLNDVTFMLSKQRIDAKIMVLKGDGTMMGVQSARLRPVETIMSGPAASAMGGRFLSDREDCLVLDMGSTSSDIAHLRKGLPRIASEGAIIGDRKTMVRSIDVLTIALGGDSHIRRGKRDPILIGPRRVVPLAMAGLQYPELADRIRETGESTFLIPHSTRSTWLEGRDAEIMMWIRDNAPCTRDEVYDGNPEIVISRNVMDRLISYGSIIETGLTPTDLMHVDGTFLAGDPECSRLGLAAEASRALMSSQQYRLKDMHKMVSMLGEGVLRKVILDETGLQEDCRSLDKILQVASGGGYMDVLNVRATVDVPLVALGGPAHLFLPALEERLGMEIILPMDHEMGNAVGTICSKISEFASVQIRPMPTGGYEILSAYRKAERRQRLQDAIDLASEIAKDDAIRRAVQAGAVSVEVEVEVEENHFTDDGGHRVVDLIVVKARATGDPMGKLSFFER